MHIRSVGLNLLKRVKRSCAGRPSSGHPILPVAPPVRHRRLSIVDFVQGDCYISYHPFASHLFQIAAWVDQCVAKGGLYLLYVSPFFNTVLLLACHFRCPRSSRFVSTCSMEYSSRQYPHSPFFWSLTAKLQVEQEGIFDAVPKILEHW